MCNGGTCTALAYDAEAKYVFVGDQSGQVTVLKLDSQSGVAFVNHLKGQKGSVQSLTWDGNLGWLFSGEWVAQLIQYKTFDSFCDIYSKKV